MTHDSEQVFYKLGELSDLLGVETSVLRFWEKEFPQIRPMKVGPRKRLYRRKDLETFQEIKRLLYEDRFTIAGAKKRLDSRTDSRQRSLFEDDDKIGAQPPPEDDQENTVEKLRAARALLDQTRRGLWELKDLLMKKTAEPVITPPPPIRKTTRKKKKSD